MANLHGMRINGMVQVDQAVRFMKSAQFAYDSPWKQSFFVDGNNGVDTNDGRTPETAFLTINAAVAAASRGDIVYVRPKAYVVGTGFGRYTETISTALAQSDLYLIGVSNSPNPEYGPRLAKITAGYSLDLLGPAFHAENIGFFAEGATGAALLENNGATNTKRGTDGTTFYNCVIKGGRVFTADGGDGTWFYKCRFHGSAGVTGGITATGSANPGRRLGIVDCIFQEGNGAAVATEYINIAGVYSEVLIQRCTFGLIPTSAKFILITASTGMMTDCFFAKANVHLTNDLTLDSIVQAGNYDTAGIVV